MSKFHSSISRREFMKAIGLAGAGMGGAALVAPIFHDLDEAMAADSSNHPGKPWWIKEREIENPTTEIDWQTWQRYDESKNAKKTSGLYMPADQYKAQVTDKNAVFSKQWMVDKKPGYTLQDKVLSGSASGPTAAWVISGVKGPESYGVPKYEGTPEENGRLLRSAMKLFGASILGYMALNERTKKLVFSAYEFRDVPKGLTDKGIDVIPSNVPLWAVGLGCPNSVENIKTSPGNVSYATAGLGHIMVEVTGTSTQKFLMGIGYQCMFGGYENAYQHPGLDAMCGMTELGRACNHAISPTAGIAFTPTSLTTDLPVVPSNPIDAGITRFCESCMKCADVCPSSALTHDGQSWDVQGGWSNPGHKQFQNNMVNCQCYRTMLGQCSTCEGVCVFTKHGAAMVHQVVKGIASTTGMFNSFFRTMDDAFGYGPQGFKAGAGPDNGKFNDLATDWWNAELPAWGADAGNSYLQ